MGTKVPQTPIVVTGLVYAAKAPYSTSWLECAAGDLILAPGGYRDILIRDGVIDPTAALAAVGEISSMPADRLDAALAVLAILTPSTEEQWRAAVEAVNHGMGLPRWPAQPETLPEPEPEQTADDAPTSAPDGEDRMVREASRRAPARGRGRGRQGGTSR